MVDDEDGEQIETAKIADCRRDGADNANLLVGDAQRLRMMTKLDEKPDRNEEHGQAKARPDNRTVWAVLDTFEWRNIEQ